MKMLVIEAGSVKLAKCGGSEVPSMLPRARQSAISKSGNWFCAKQSSVAQIA
jgi:hypothetical protein